MKKLVKFLKEVRVELRKVRWPTKSQTMKLTTVVLFITLVVAFYIGALDFVFAKIMEVILR